ncbi:MAG: preprotein translocase subunit YajC [Bacillota bacterium]
MKDPQGLTSIVTMILVWVAVLYLFIFFPQRKQQKARQKMLGSLKKGDKVVTIGGMHGEIVELGGDDVMLRVGNKVEIKFEKSAVSRLKGD